MEKLKERDVDAFWLILHPLQQLLSMEFLNKTLTSCPSASFFINLSSHFLNSQKCLHPQHSKASSSTAVCFLAQPFFCEFLSTVTHREPVHHFCVPPWSFFCFAASLFTWGRWLHAVSRMQMHIGTAGEQYAVFFSNLCPTMQVKC